MTEITREDHLAAAANHLGSYIHADAAVIAETGILIRGSSGAGKSRLVMTLTSMAETAGFFARLVGDDRVYLERAGGRIVARGHPSLQGAIEWRGQGIYQASFTESAVLGLVIDLVASAKSLSPRYPRDEDLQITITGVPVRAMTLQSDLGPSDQASYILQYFRLNRKNFGGFATVGTFP
jgi:HPr kinase/phosphorylase